MNISIKPIKCKNGKTCPALLINGIIVTFDVVTIARVLDVPISYVESIEREESLHTC